MIKKRYMLAPFTVFCRRPRSPPYSTSGVLGDWSRAAFNSKFVENLLQHITIFGWFWKGDVFGFSATRCNIFLQWASVINQSHYATDETDALRSPPPLVRLHSLHLHELSVSSMMMAWNNSVSAGGVEIFHRLYRSLLNHRWSFDILSQHTCNQCDFWSSMDCFV